MSTRSTGTGILIALRLGGHVRHLRPVRQVAARDRLDTRARSCFLRIAGAALMLLVPTVRALGGRWHLLRRSGARSSRTAWAPSPCRSWPSSTRSQHLSVGVALLLEYLGLVLVVAWQCLAARRLPRPPTVVGIVLALVGLALVLDLPDWAGRRVRIDGIGVAWGLFAAVGLASYFLLSGTPHETAAAAARAGRRRAGRGRARRSRCWGSPGCCR